MSSNTKDDKGKNFCRLDLIDSSESVEKLNLAKTTKLKVKEAELQDGLAKQKQARDEKKPENEQVTFFESSFKVTQKSIEDKLCQTSDLSEKRQELTAMFDNIVVECQKLSTFVAQSKLFLPNFTFTKYQGIVDGLQQKVQERKQELLPKKKFAFRERRKAGENSASVEGNKSVTVKEDVSETTSAATTVESGYTVKNKNGVSVEVESKEIEGQDVQVQHLRKSEVKLLGSPSTLHLTNLVDCDIYTGPVATSVFIEDCSGCNLHVACQQLRTHNTTDTTIHLHVTTRAIVEDCRRIQFTPYRWTYRTINDDWDKSGLDRERNNWKGIDDFNWLVANQPSPHYSFIEPTA